jgi:hypothetical protein
MRSLRRLASWCILVHDEYMTMMIDFPALNSETVTERHARICRERGHASHVVDGVVQTNCPRCGENTEAEVPESNATFDRMIRLEGEVKMTGAVAAMAPVFWERDRATERLEIFKTELDKLFASLSLAELAAFGQYRQR